MLTIEIQIRATTDENHSKVISGSEDGSVYIWNSGLSPKQSNVDDSTGTEKSERNWFGKVKKVDNFVGGVESFEGENQSDFSHVIR